MKKITICFLVFLLLTSLSGCAYPEDMINVISRENGSGTRDAFSGLFELLEKQNDGLEVDETLKEAEITNSTAVVLQTVSEDPNSIGYMSMGSLNNQVKTLNIDGVAALKENVKNGSYPIFRPFLIVKKKDTSELENDFISYLLSNRGQKIIEDEGYISINSNAEDYQPSSLEGSLSINGSSSVAPVMEALVEDYKQLNPQIAIELQQTDSTTGISSVSEGVADIGMSSRELKDTEIDSGLEPVKIAYDGLAVIVNKDNPINSLSIDQIHNIYTGKIRSWDALLGVK